MDYRLAVFDLDGTILDTLADLAGSVNYALAQSGLARRTTNEVRCFVGNGMHSLIERSVPLGTPPELSAAVFSDFQAHYRLHCADHTKPYSGIPELLTQLRARGVKTAVVSNKADFSVQALCRQYFDGLFDAAVGERPDVRRKPAPDSVNAVLRALQIEPEDAVYIGDSEVDIQTAKNAGLACISVSWGFRERSFLQANGASLIVCSPVELLQKITPNP